jgi:hypothetical protein
LRDFKPDGSIGTTTGPAAPESRSHGASNRLAFGVREAWSLSKHLSALAGAGYVEVSRVRADSRSRRQVTLTTPGRTALRGHLAALQAIAAAAEPAVAEEPSGAHPPERHQARRDVALDTQIA